MASCDSGWIVTKVDRVPVPNISWICSTNGLQLNVNVALTLERPTGRTHAEFRAVTTSSIRSFAVASDRMSDSDGSSA